MGWNANTPDRRKLKMRIFIDSKKGGKKGGGRLKGKGKFSHEGRGCA